MTVALRDFPARHGAMGSVGGIIGTFGGAAALALFACASPSRAQEAGEDIPAYSTATDLPSPVADPLDVDFSSDPILALGSSSADPGQFRRIVVAAVEQNASSREADANVAVAAAQLDEAEAGRLPTGDVTVSSYRTIARNFSDDPFNIIERSRATRRTDVLGEVEYVLLDFGATYYGIAAAQARLTATGHEREAAVSGTITQFVSVWYAVFAYQSLVRLGESFVSSQADIQDAVERRIAQGASARSDLARVASLRAQGEIRLAQFRRQLASAEARFEELSGIAPPARLLRAPQLVDGIISRDYAINAAQAIPEVRSAEAQARAAQSEAKATEGANQPRVAARLDAGRYGVYENEGDYDVRGSINLRYRLFGGGGNARLSAARARADAADAAADRVRQEAERDAAVTWADVRALEDQLIALDAAYKSSRQTRDVVVTRFGALRGSLFDVTEAESAYLQAAVAYIEGLSQLDAARYLLLARTGRLLEAFDVDDLENGVMVDG